MKYKKPLIALGIVVTLSIIFFLAQMFLFSPILGCQSSGATLVTTDEASGKTNEQVYRLLADRYFSRQKSITCGWNRLDDYRIDQLSVSDPGFPEEFTMSYSVKPSVRGNADWVAGNGVEEGAWIVKKFGFVVVSKNSDGLGISAINTAP